MTISADDCARELLEVVPHLMRLIRAEMRSQRTPDLSVPQFRSLAFVKANPRASLSAAAEHIGLTLPSMSNLVDGLVQRKLVTRQPCATDRRRVLLELTPRGRRVLQAARTAAQARLSRQLDPLTEEERSQLVAATHTLRRYFGPNHEAAAS